MTLRLQNASFCLGNKTLLDNISVEFHPSQLTVILGPNGTGKSALLKLLCREWACQGDLFFYNKPSSHWTPQALAMSMGVLPQHSNLTFSFTVKEVVELGGLAFNAPQKEIENIAAQKMHQTDVLHLQNRTYPGLSGGEKQRVHLARVLTQLEKSPRPPILLLDEPTSALDIKHQHKTLLLAKAFAKNNATVIAVIHDLNLACVYADRIIMLEGGKIVADGSREKVLTSKNIENVYGWPVEVIKHPTSNRPLILG